MATKVLLDDLLPTLFDSTVAKLTRKKLLSVEREGIVTALVNSVGESVLRRIREADTDGYKNPESVFHIETTDRFSDGWISRVEIVDNIDRSSGLGATLSELALFFIESRLDTFLAGGEVTVVSIGRIKIDPTMSEIRSEVRQLLQLKKNYLELETPHRDRAVAKGRSLVFADAFAMVKNPLQVINDFWSSFWTDQDLGLPLLEQAQSITAFRRPLSYNIELSDGLAFNRERKPDFEQMEFYEESSPEGYSGQVFT